MAILSVALAGDALRSFFLDGLRTQINEKASPTVAAIERTTENVTGKDVKMALRYGRQGGVGNRADDGDLPTPFSRQTKEAKFVTKNIFARFQITDKTIEASKNNLAAFADLLAQELKDAETDAKDSVARQYFGDGTGLLTTVNGAPAGTALTVGSTVGLYEGMAIDSYTSVGVAHDAGMRITKVDDENGTITVDAITATVSGDYLYITGNKDKELTGLLAVFRAATLYDIARADYPWLNANRKNVNGEISEVAIQECIDQAEIKAGGTIDFIIAAYGVRRAYQDLLTAQKSQVNTMKLAGGWTVLTYNGIPFVPERYTTAGTLRFLNLADWKLYQMDDWDWMDRDGNVLSRVANKPAYEATLRKYAEIGCQCPRGQVEAYGITER